MMELTICYCVTAICGAVLYANRVIGDKDQDERQKNINAAFDRQIMAMDKHISAYRIDAAHNMDEFMKRLEDLEKTNKRVDALVLKAGFKV